MDQDTGERAAGGCPEPGFLIQAAHSKDPMVRGPVLAYTP